MITEFKLDKQSGLLVPIDAKVRPVEFGFRAPVAKVTAPDEQEVVKAA